MKKLKNLPAPSASALVRWLVGFCCSATIIENAMVSRKQLIRSATLIMPNWPVNSINIRRVYHGALIILAVQWSRIV